MSMTIIIMINKALLSSRKQNWATPKDFFDKLDSIFKFKLDPCASDETAKCETYMTKEIDGLKQDWSRFGNAFVNPPFGRELPKWMCKCMEESSKGITVVMLIPARTDTQYWHDMAFAHASCICFIRGRLTFELPESKTPKEEWVAAPFPNALVVFGRCSVEQRESLIQFGKVYGGES